MENFSIIVHPDAQERETLKRALARILFTEILEFSTDEEALACVETSSGELGYLFTPWELSEAKKHFSQQLKTTSAGKRAFLFLTTSPDDIDWIRPTLSALENFGDLLGDPSHTETFLSQVQQLMNPVSSVKTNALIVDDEIEIRGILRQYLEAFGFTHISEASNGDEALTLLEQNPGIFSVVLSDWQMPQMSGLELLKKVRALPETSRIAFLMVTSKTPVEQLKTIQAADFGVNGYILKPFTMKSFHSQLGTVLNEIAQIRAADALLVAGRTSLGSGNSLGAKTIFQNALSLFPENAQMMEAFGDSLVFRNSETVNLLAAASVYEKALSRSPYHTGLFIKCFEVYTALGKMNEAVRLLKTYKPRFVRDDSFRTRLGKIYLQNGYPDLASVEFYQALISNPQNTEAKDLKKLAESQGLPLKKTG